MKRTGLMAVVLAAAMAVACGDGARDVDNDNAAIDNAPAVGTGGEVADTRNDETRDVQEFVRDVAIVARFMLPPSRLFRRVAMVYEVRAMPKRHSEQALSRASLTLVGFGLAMAE